MSNIDVAKTIIQQIEDGTDIHGNSGRVLLMCWGADRFTGTPQSEDDRGKLSFSVKARKFKGHVQITLTWMDTYTVKFFKKKKGCLTVVHEINDVYFMELASVIDSYVESNQESIRA